jgi:hypothetical protein
VTDQESPQDRTAAGDGIKAVLGCLGSLAAVVALYLGALALVGDFPSTEFGAGQYALGALAVLVSAGVISVVGESVIEDVVKFVVIGGGFFLIYRGQEGVIALMALGVTVGTALPLLMRPVSRWMGDD